MHSRRRSRQVALQILFQMDASSLTAVQAIPLYWQNLRPSDHPQDVDEPRLADRAEKVDETEKEDEAGFAESLVRGVDAQRESIDQVIREASEHWRLERMPAVDRTVLRLGAYELIHLQDTPVRVVLNEAVELAKRFGSADSPAFVNGVLDHIARRVRGAS
jgi:N utilization substance protein B